MLGEHEHILFKLLVQDTRKTENMYTVSGKSL